MNSRKLLWAMTAPVLLQALTACTPSDRHLPAKSSPYEGFWLNESAYGDWQRAKASGQLDLNLLCSLIRMNPAPHLGSSFGSGGSPSGSYVAPGYSSGNTGTPRFLSIRPNGEVFGWRPEVGSTNNTTMVGRLTDDGHFAMSSTNANGYNQNNLHISAENASRLHVMQYLNGRPSDRAYVKTSASAAKEYWAAIARCGGLAQALGSGQGQNPGFHTPEPNPSDDQVYLPGQQNYGGQPDLGAYADGDQQQFSPAPPNAGPDAPGAPGAGAPSQDYPLYEQYKSRR